MARCEDCVLLEILGSPGDEPWNRCHLSNVTNLDVLEEREYTDFQPGA